MRRIIFLMNILLVVTVTMSAQTVTVESFVCSPTDLSAATNPVLDKNGVPCALVKIWSMDEISKVDGNVIGNIRSSGHEHSVYLTKGTKEMRIIFNSSLPLHVKFAEYGVNSLESKVTYVLTIDHPTTGTINGHDYVDLGLSVKWATCNIGATSPSDIGNYYAFGETSTKTNFTKDNYKAKSLTYGEVISTFSHDAARANWGGTWRLPELSEVWELFDEEKCSWTWLKQDDSWGFRVTGPNGNSIFLPATGCYADGKLEDVKDIGDYWIIDARFPSDEKEDAESLVFSSKGMSMPPIVARYVGRTIRPISE